MKKTAWAHIAMLSATLLYGANYRIAKNLMPDTIPPFAFIMLRIAGAGLVFWLLHALFIREKIAKRDVGRLFWCGFFGAALNMLSFFKGLSMTSPLHASIIMVVTPILLLLISCIFAAERLTWRKTAGVALGFIGAVLLILSGSQNFTPSNTSIWGDGLVLLNASSYALYLVLAQPLMQRYHPLTVIKWVFLFGGFCSLPIAWQECSQLDITIFSTTQWLYLLFVVLGATACTYLLNITALRYVPPSAIGYYVYGQPVIAAILDIILGYAWPNTWTFTATACIFVGAYIVNRRKSTIVHDARAKK